MSVWAMTRMALSPGAFGAADIAVPLEWTATYWTVMFLMWWVMMIAMMVPSAAPVILLYARVTRHTQKGSSTASGVIPTAVFACGYLIAWMGFSALAVALQFGLELVGLTSPMMMWSIDPWLSVCVLLAAGIYQLTSLKRILSRPLSDAGAIPLQLLATWTRRRVADGRLPWSVLRGLLLGANGAAVCRGNYEFSLDRWSCDLRSCREDFADGPTSRPRWRHCLYRRRSVAGCSRNRPVITAAKPRTGASDSGSMVEGGASVSHDPR